MATGVWGAHGLAALDKPGFEMTVSKFWQSSSRLIKPQSGHAVINFTWEGWILMIWVWSGK